MSWSQFVQQPLTHMPREALHACLGQASAALAERVVTEPRFAERLLALFEQHHRLTPLAQLPAPAPGIDTLLNLPAAQQGQLARLCGALWHAATLAREVRGEVLQPLREHLGEAVYAMAVQHRDQAGAADLLRDPAALMAAIDHDGAQAIAYWLQAQPAALRPWLALRLNLPATALAPPALPPSLVTLACQCLSDTEQPQP